MSYTKKTLKDLTIRDNFLFAAVMQQEDNCKQFLEMLLDIKIDRIHIQYEKTLIFNPEYKGIRMDVYARDDMHTCYNIEMQVASMELSKRSRYYHSQIDMELLNRGEDYDCLSLSYVIFICDFDPFNLRRYCYSFENICLEESGLKLQDGNRTIFLSTRGENPEDISPQLLNFLTFVRENNPSESRDYHDPYVEQLQNSIFQIKQNQELGSRYMLLELMLKDEYKKGILEGKVEGKIEGKIEGKAESIIHILQASNSIPAELRSYILKQCDDDVLTDMLLKAASANSIEQFMKSISFTSNQ